jgi:hypothetical protein
MKMTITRFMNIEDGTLGVFSLQKGSEVVLKGYTLEPAGSDTTSRGLDRRIPEGMYKIDWHNSPKFGRFLPLVWNNDVPKDRYILIHSGNYPKHTEGCILVGCDATYEGVFNSKLMLDKLLDLLRQESENRLEITSDYNRDRLDEAYNIKKGRIC